MITQRFGLFPRSFLNGLRIVFLVILLSASACNFAFSQVLFGKVIDKNTKSPIALASVKLIGEEYGKRVRGVAADENGEFFLVVSSFPVQLEVTSVGYASKRVRIEELQSDLVIELDQGQVNLGEFVIKADKITERELRSPIQIEKISLKEIRNSASFNFYDAVANLKGVDVATQSAVINTVNARGFNSNTNLRFRQFADGIDSQAPGLGFSLGNVVGPSTLDVESMELIPGPTTSRFGPGVFNGVLDLKTKNPFDYRGLSVEVKGASIGGPENNDQFFTLGDMLVGEVSMRYANVIKEKVGFKINGTYLSGSDYPAINYDNIGAGEIWQNVHSTDNQGINLVNAYGDDRAAFLVLPLSSRVVNSRDTSLFVTRAGYREEDLVNYNTENLKLNGSLNFKLGSQTELELATFYGKVSAMITGDDRIALRDFQIQQHKFEVKNSRFNILGYTTMQDAGNSFNAGRLGEVMVQSAKPDELWYNQYQTFYLAGTGGPAGMQAARERADTAFPGRLGFEARFEPGTARFDSLRNVIVNTLDPETGAKLFDKSRLYHLQMDTRLDVGNGFFESFEVGANGRLYDPDSRGIVFTDTVGNDITNFEFGGFVEASHKLNQSTDLTASLRIDKNENFDVISSQRISAVNRFGNKTFFRLSLQRGQRLPNIREQFSNQNLGDLRLVGGLKDVVGQYDLQNNAILLNSLQEYNQTISEELNRQVFFSDDLQPSIGELQTKHLNIIQDGIIGTDRFNGLKPETITSLEFGIRTLLDEKRIIEAVAYINHYNNFIGVTRVVKPRTSPSVDLLLATSQANNPSTSDVIFVSDNASESIITQGVEFVYDVTSDQGTNFVANFTYANISKNSNDPITPGFNTPRFKFNMSVGNDFISSRFGAKISWRYRSEFEWESNFVDGTIPSFNTFDFQMTYRIPEIFTSIRFGGNNVLNRQQFNTFGGPEIRSMYYFSLNLEPFSK